RNTIPGDTRPPTQASGLRLGTPAVTTRGFGVAECETVADLIARSLAAPDDEVIQRTVAKEVRALTTTFPVPGIDDDEA
ncbi:MAG: serine hydroxymethyltransferase, partial [Chloroflexota bacterium]|nr:serine hydroxymethyltransferase [Chloroflexota bacterium]